MRKVRTQTCAAIRQCILGHAYKQNKVHALSEVRYNVLAEEGIKQGTGNVIRSISSGHIGRHWKRSVSAWIRSVNCFIKPHRRQLFCL